MVCERCAHRQQPERPLRGVLEVASRAEIHGSWDPLDLLPVEREFFPKYPWAIPLCGMSGCCCVTVRRSRCLALAST